MTNFTLVNTLLDTLINLVVNCHGYATIYNMILLPYMLGEVRRNALRPGTKSVTCYRNDAAGWYVTQIQKKRSHIIHQ